MGRALTLKKVVCLETNTRPNLRSLGAIMNDLIGKDFFKRGPKTPHVVAVRRNRQAVNQLMQSIVRGNPYYEALY